jgi:hypothetical protein
VVVGVVVVSVLFVAAHLSVVAAGDTLVALDSLLSQPHTARQPTPEHVAASRP